MAEPIVTLLTDFGAGTYVAQMKAVLLGRLPRLRLVDVAHDVPPQDICEASFRLAEAAFWFPSGTVHLVVVDPGVGSDRRPIAVSARGHHFVGPDNGVLAPAFEQPGAEVVHLDRGHLFLHPVSGTFHGRDVFAPVAAELAAGLPLADLGTALHDPIPSVVPRPTFETGTWQGALIRVDRFGNVQSNVPVTDPVHQVRVNGTEVPWCRSYDRAHGENLIALPSSSGFVEVALPGGSAHASGVLPGQPIEVTANAPIPRQGAVPWPVLLP